MFLFRIHHSAEITCLTNLCSFYATKDIFNNVFFDRINVCVTLFFILKFSQKETVSVRTSYKCINNVGFVYIPTISLRFLTVPSDYVSKLDGLLKSHSKSYNNKYRNIMCFFLVDVKFT